MDDLLHRLGERLSARRLQGRDRVRRRLSRHFVCNCGNDVHFEEMSCRVCAAPLGYLPHECRLVALSPGPLPETKVESGRDISLRFCSNHNTPAGCNWMVPADDPILHCVSCRLNRTIPNLTERGNAQYWAKLERAKRRVVSHLLALGSPVHSKLYEDPENGLMFDFLRSPPGGPQVMTGHADGLITINIEEADDSKREKIREAMHEPYRTLIGHFRHEVGHYYWTRLVWKSVWLEPFRQLFGDERASYGEALKRNYEEGPPANWVETHISAYATMHPWEDWAETWAHYMHIADGLVTAMGFGFDADDIEEVVEPIRMEALYAPEDCDASFFLSLVNGWKEITVMLNEMARSMGQPDFYPFELSNLAVAKLQFVQIVVSNARAESLRDGKGNRA